MTTPTPDVPEPAAAAPATAEGPAAEASAAEVGGAAAIAGAAAAAPAPTEKRRRRRIFLLLLLAGLSTMLLVIAGFYLLNRKPLPDLVPPIAQDLPHYLYSIYGVDTPIGVAVSPGGDRIYVTENGGKLLVKTFDAGGKLLTAATPAKGPTSPSIPVYVARDPLTGEVYVTDRYTKTIGIFSEDGTFARSFTPPPAIDQVAWAPLGIAFDAQGLLYVTDVGTQGHRILVIDRNGGLLRTLDNEGSLLFPNALVPRSGDLLVSDSNNGRVLRFTTDGPARTVIGRGEGDGDVGLPRGIAVGANDRLFVVDTIAQGVNVYRLTADNPRPVYLGTFGTEGREDGQFEYPNGLALDDRGHVFVADRENNRIQVWSY